jgi:hypothetical protein
VQIGQTPLYVLAAEPRCCPHCSAVMVDDARFCGMCGKGVPAGPPLTLDADSRRPSSASVRRLTTSSSTRRVPAGRRRRQPIQDAQVVFAARRGRPEARARAAPSSRRPRPGRRRRPDGSGVSEARQRRRVPVDHRAEAVAERDGAGVAQRVSAPVMSARSA